jgi:hypothetical protein
MAFDPASAKPVTQFDPASARAVAVPSSDPIGDLPPDFGDATMRPDEIENAAHNVGMSVAPNATTALESIPPLQPGEAKNEMLQAILGPLGRSDVAATIGNKLVPVAPAAGGMWGMMTGLGNELVSGFGGTPDVTAADAATNVTKALSYEPRTPMGKAVGGVIDLPMEAIGTAGGALGGKVLDKSNSPMLATLADTAVQALPMLVGGKHAGEALKAPDPVRAATAPSMADLAASEHTAAGQPSATAPTDQAVSSLMDAVHEAVQPPPAPQPESVAPPAQAERVATPAKPGEQPTPVPPPPANIAAMLDNAPPEVKQSAVGQLADQLRQPGARETQAAPNALPEVVNEPANLRGNDRGSGAGVDRTPEPKPPAEPMAQAPDVSEVPPADVARPAVDQQPVEQNVPQPELAGRNPITDRLAAKLRDHDSAVAEYSAIPETNGGTVLNVDTARELSPDYIKDRTRSADVHEPASAFIKRMYAEKLAEPTPEGKEPTVLFTAGGTGAGKSTGIGLLGDSLKPEITYDTNMNSYDSAKAKIEQALAAGRNVKILYTYRDPVEALRNGALPRSAGQERKFGSGRTVPLAEHARTHTGSYDVVNRLAQEYNGDRRVEIVAADNSRGRGNAQIVPLDQIPNPGKEGLHEQLRSQLEAAHRSGEISDAIRTGFEAESQRPVVGAGDRGQPQQERPAGSPAQVNRSLNERLRSPTRTQIEDEGGDVAVAEPPPKPKPERPQAQTEVSARNAAVDADRIARDLPEIPEAERQEWEKPHADALAKIEADPAYPKRLAAEVAAKPRPISAEETMALTHDLRELTAEHSNATKAVLEARSARDTIGEASAIARLRDAEEALTRNHEAIRVGGTEAARALSIRNAIVKDDYSIGRNMDRAKVAFGDKFDAETKQAVEHLSQKIKEQDERIAELEKQQEAKARAKQPKTADERMQERIQKQMDELQSKIEARTKVCPL